MDITVVKEYVRNACMNRENIFEPEFFDQHLAVVAHYGLALAEITGADRDIVETAAWIHDIFAIQNPKRIAEHAAGGSVLAKEFLVKNGYDTLQADRIAQCVLTHSAPLHPGKGTIEEICMSNADAISQIVKPVYWFFYAFHAKNLCYADGLRWVRDKIESNWQNLIPEAKKLVVKEYFFAKKILETV